MHRVGKVETGCLLENLVKVEDDRGWRADT